jgi:drug/metabolite transporter (DMT)-like permease
VSLARWLDDGIPLAVLAGGLLLSGRVATDVAGRLGALCALGAAVLVGLVGTAVSRAGEAHGDGVEAGQIAVAVAVVLVLTGGSALWVEHRRSGRRRPTG